MRKKPGCAHTHTATKKEPPKPDGGVGSDKQAHDQIPDGYLLKDEVASRLRITTKTLERWMREGIVPFIKLGKRRRASVLFRWDRVQEHLETEFAGGVR
jgi:excisionase family DNA binding protein